MTSLHGERYDRGDAEDSTAVDPANPQAEGTCVYLGKADAEQVQPEAMQQLFQRLTTLRHPNVARVRELSLEDDALTLVVDPVHGMPLSEYVATREPGIAEVRKLSIQLVSALAYLQKHLPGLRLRLEHVLVGDGSLVLTGANLVQLKGVSWPRDFPSSIAFAIEAPEPEEKRDETATVFTAGAVTYHMLTRVAAGSARDAWGAAAIAFEHFVRERVPPSDLVRNIPKQWDEAVLRALSVNPGDRFPTLEALQQALAELEALDYEDEEAAAATSSPLPAPLPLDLPFPYYLEPDNEASGSRWLIPGMTVMGLALAAAVFVAAWFVVGGHTKTLKPAQLAAVSGLRLVGSAPVSGSDVILAWSPVVGADRYRVRITASSDGKTSTFATSRPRYAFRNAAGQQSFVWMASAHTSNGWTPFSPARTFIVRAPRVGVPALIRPTDKQISHTKNVTFCWLAVTDARGYLLRAGTLTVHTLNRCHLMTLGYGKYAWTVTAQVQGTRLYTGPTAPPRVIDIVPARGRATAAPTATTFPAATAVAPGPPVVSQPPPVPTAVVAAPVAPAPVNPAPTAPACVPFVNC